MLTTQEITEHVLMQDMEKQGCYLVDQQSFTSEEEAYRFGKSVALKT